MEEEKSTKQGLEQEQIQNHKQELDWASKTCDLMFKTLCNLGMQPKKNEDGTITVWYQGLRLYMEFTGYYVRIWHWGWAGIEENDPNLPKFREAINTANYNCFGTTVVLDKPNDKGMIAFHSISDILLHEAVPDNETYVRSVLDSFSSAKEEVICNFKLIDARQKEARNNRRPVGFTTETNTTDSNE